MTKTAKVSDILGIINKLAPPFLAESWDNVGLQTGDPTTDVTAVMVALDPGKAVIEEAVAAGCTLLVTHHPLIFKPLKSISAATPLGKSLHSAIRNNLSVISMHTNYDCATGGLNDVLAARLGLEHCQVLQATANQELVKLVVFVPETSLDSLRRSLLPFAESLGAYRDCSFAAAGQGTFTPQEGAHPTIGTVGTFEQVPEYRLELLLDRERLTQAIKALMSAHPYEEPAFDIYPLANTGIQRGLGRIGRLSSPLPLGEFARQVAGNLYANGVRFVGKPDTIVSKVALCSGGGISVMRSAVRAGAHVLVTGDVKYHEARDAEDLGIALIDAGHFSTEIIMVDAVRELLDLGLKGAGFDGIRILPATTEHDPYQYLTGSQ